MLFKMFVIGFLGFFNFEKSLCDDLNNNTLKLVQILFRHGERSPTKTYTNDPHKNHPWPGGWDQLSNKGKIELYDLGQDLKLRYKDVLSQIYNPDKMYVLSSYADRCHMSAQLLLAGLYKPVRNQIWNSDLLWQPIPVHELPRNLDNKVALKKPCPKYELALQKAYTTEKLRKINEKNAWLYDYLSEKTGDEIRNIRQLETLFNTLEIEQINNLSLPLWTEKVFPENMKDLAALSLAIFTDTQFMKRMHGGMLVKEMISNMAEKRNDSKKELFLYSGHDLTLVSLLRCLGIEELYKPQFGASVILELHNVNKEYFIKLFLKETPYVEVKELKLEKCGVPCTLEKISSLLTPIMPQDWERDCEVQQ